MIENFFSGIRDLFTTQPILLKPEVGNDPSANVLNNILNFSNTDVDVDNWFNYGTNWNFYN